MTTNAIDLSYSALDVSALAGIDLVIQNLWTGLSTPAVAISNLEAARTSGQRIAGYMVVNPSIPDNVANARTGIPADLWAVLAFVAVDCELYPTLTPAKVRVESDRLAALLPARPRVLYTVESYWRGVLGNDTTFGDHVLWDARPGDRPFSPYGPWGDASQVIGVQTTSTVQLGSMSVDYNQFDLGRLGMGAPQPPARTADVASLMIRDQIAGAVLRNDMRAVVDLLAYFGVIVPQVALKDAV